MFETKSHIASDIMRKFLQETSEIHAMKHKMNSFYGRMRKLQDAFRAFKAAQEDRVQSFAKLQWEKERQALVK